MSKNRHLLVSKKTKKKAKSGGAKKTKSGAALPSGSNQTKEEQWDAVSPNISALLQGRGTIPLDVVPFDATSDVSIEDQKVTHSGLRTLLPRKTSWRSEKFSLLTWALMKRKRWEMKMKKTGVKLVKIWREKRRRKLIMSLSLSVWNRSLILMHSLPGLP